MKKILVYICTFCFALNPGFCGTAVGQDAPVISDETEAVMSPQDLSEESIYQKMEESPGEDEDEKRQQKLIQWSEDQESKIEAMQEERRLDKRD